MSEFTPITTQEEFDAKIQDRLKRERNKFDGYMSPEDVAEKYKDYLSPDDVTEKYKGYMSPEDVDKKYNGYLSPDDVTEKYKGYLSPEEAAAKDRKIKGFEISSYKLKAAYDFGIPQELAERLSGETEEDIRKDAKLFAGYTKQKTAPPLKDTEQASGGNPKKEAYKKLLKNVEGDG